MVLNVGAITFLGLLASSPGVPSKPVTQPIVIFASAPSTCAVLQAAYTAAIGRTSPAYPQMYGCRLVGLMIFGSLCRIIVLV
jgi:hypothetical protein